MLPEQEALYTVHNAPKHVAKSHVIHTQLEESLVACVMCALCSLAAIQPAVFRKLRTQNSPLHPSHSQKVLQPLSSTMIT